MEKSVVLIRGETESHAASFQRWYLKDFAPHALAKNSKITGWQINVVKKIGDAPNAYDVASEIWGSSEARSSIHREFSKLWPATIWEYEVDERIEKSLPYPESSSIKVIGCTLPKLGLTSSEVRRFWDSHVAVALDVHVGMARYSRNWVTQPPLGAAPRYFGFPMLTFPTAYDFQERYFGSAEAKRRHALDVGQFVGPTARLICDEHILLPPTSA
jgi:hypothetical protein